MGGAGRCKGLICMDWTSLGLKEVAIVRSREVAVNQGFLKYCVNGDAAGTKVSVRSRQSGRQSGVAVKRGFTVLLFLPSPLGLIPLSLTGPW